MQENPYHRNQLFDTWCTAYEINTKLIQVLIFPVVLWKVCRESPFKNLKFLKLYNRHVSPNATWNAARGLINMHNDVISGNPGHCACLLMATLFVV